MSFRGRLHPGIEDHGPQVDVLVQVKAGVQQDALLQDARGHVRVADGPQVDGLELPQLGDHRLRQGLTGAHVALAAQVVIGVVEFEPRGTRHGLEHLDALGHHFRAGAVPGDDCDVVRSHADFASRCFLTKAMRPPSDSSSCMKGGMAWLGYFLPVVRSVMTPVSMSTLIFWPPLISAAASGALENGQAHVKGVAVEDPGEAPGDHPGDARGLQGDGGVLPGGAAAEILPGHDEIPRLHLIDKLRVRVLHGVFGQLHGVGGVEIPGRNDLVGVDVVAEFVHLPFEFHAGVSLLWF